MKLSNKMNLALWYNTHDELIVKISNVKNSNTLLYLYNHFEKIMINENLFTYKSEIYINNKDIEWRKVIFSEIISKWNFPTDIKIIYYNIKLIDTRYLLPYDAVQ